MRKLSLTFIFTILFFTFISCSQKNSKFSLLNFAEENLLALSPAAVNSFVDLKDETGDMFYKFTENQMNEVNALFIDKNLRSVEITLQNLSEGDYGKEKDKSFTLGLLYKDDFDEKGKLKSQLEGRGQVSGNICDYQSENIKVSLASRIVPAGFYVRAKPGVKVEGISFEELKIGFEISDKTLLFAFGYDGGILQKTFTSADFVEADNLFVPFNSSEGLLPKIEMSFKKLSDYGSERNPVKVKAKYGSENFSIVMSPACQKLTLQTSAFKSKNSILQLKENADLVTSIMMKANAKASASQKIIDPFETDLAFVLDWPRENWRCDDYELYQWNLFPKVLFFDFKDYDTQSRFLTRMAYFVEKEGYKGSLQSDYFVATHRGYNAHDYKAQDMAAFFSKAVLENFNLNEEELLLRTILVHNKIINPQSDGTFTGNEGSIISISRETAASTRVQLMAHESWHGIYFSSQDFRNFVESEYNNFDPTCWSFMKAYFKSQNLGYDPNDDYLMKNEFMAYHMQRSVEESQIYWKERASWSAVNAMAPAQCAHVRKTNASHIAEQSQRFSDYVFKTWGLSCGKAWLCERN